MIAFGTQSTITNLYLGDTEVGKAYLGDVLVWPEIDGLRLTSDSGTSTIGLSQCYSAHTIEYSTDNGDSWNTFDTGTTITLNEGKSVYLRGTLTEDVSLANRTELSIDGYVSAHGIANRIIDYGSESDTTLVYKDCMSYLFNGCTGLYDASDLRLPATTLTVDCYLGMFYNCTNLVYGPKYLPATHLANACYSVMFKYCHSLVESPVIVDNITDDGLGEYAISTFHGCLMLNKITCLWHNPYKDPYNDGNSPWTSNWVAYAGDDATGDKVFIKNANMTNDWSTTGISGIPVGWTVQDAS